MFFTFDVFKLDTSSDVRLEQPPNIPPMFFTLDVSKPDTSSDVRLEQLLNMELISVMPDVSILLRSIVFTLRIPKNRLWLSSVILVVWAVVQYYIVLSFIQQ